MKFYSLVFTCIIIPFALLSQVPDDEDLVQFTGRIRNELLEPLPYAHILVLNSYRGAITDKDGKFTFVVEKNDSVLFSTVGYKRKIIIVPDTLTEPFLYKDVILSMDTIMIGEVRVYPWKNYEEFKKAFVNLDLPDKDMENARKNIAIIKTQIILDLEPSARANYRYILDQQYRETFNKTGTPTSQLLNPFAWAKFFEAIKRGDYRRKKD